MIPEQYLLNSYGIFKIDSRSLAKTWKFCTFLQIITERLRWSIRIDKHELQQMAFKFFESDQLFLRKRGQKLKNRLTYTNTYTFFKFDFERLKMAWTILRIINYTTHWKIIWNRPTILHLRISPVPPDIIFFLDKV